MRKNYKIATLFLIIVIASIFCTIQYKQFKNNSLTENKKIVGTTAYAGTYGLKSKRDEGSFETISIFPETDSSILFYVEMSKGAPSYDSGAIYGRATMEKNIGTFIEQEDSFTVGEKCKLRFEFNSKSLNIKNLSNVGDDGFYCGFGGSLFPAENTGTTFPMISDKIPTYFVDREGDYIFFKTNKPEDETKAYK